MPLDRLRGLLAGRLPVLALLDLDGTLVDSAPDIARALDAALAAAGHAPVGEARVRAWVGRGSRTLVQQALAHQRGATAPGHEVEALLAAYLQRYCADCVALTGAMPGAPALLAALAAHGVRLACVTNKPEGIAARVLAHVFPAVRFELLVGGDSGAGVKPAPGPLRAVLGQLGVAPGDALMIGDSRHDVHAARAAGVAVACVANGYNHGEDVRDEHPDLVVDSLLELL